MKEKFAKLVDVKSIITFALVGCVCYLAIAGKIEVSSEFFASIVSAVITYYFTRKLNGEDAGVTPEEQNTDEQK